jgi:HD-GYP domain-containing protein (c-di-GMP phosphodiesterase class II)
LSEPRRELDAQLILLGRELISLWMALFRAVRLYQSDNEAIGKLGEKIREKVEQIQEDSGDVEMTVRHDSIFICGERIRESAIGSSLYHGFIDLLRAARLKGLKIEETVTNEELELFARQLLDVSAGERSTEEMVSELKIRASTHIELELLDEEEDLIKEVDQELVAKQIYLRSIGIVKGVFDSLRKTDRINSRRIKRVVQQMIESLNFNPENLINLTNLKNYDEYTFNHSVNVSVLAIALGRHLGLTRQQLYVLGQAGMLHDLGKLNVPKEILNKTGKLTREERNAIQMHSIDGFLTAATQMGINEGSIDVALASYEHHMNIDGSGYPTTPAAGAMGLLSRILSIVDRYDAMTSTRVYRKQPIPPHKALAIMFHSQQHQHDRGLLRYFMNMMGVFPLGTVVRLSDDSLGVVVGGAKEPQLRHFPLVKMILDQDGRPASGEKLDLSATAKDPEPLRVEEIVDAGDYGIEIMDYIL